MLDDPFGDYSRYRKSQLTLVDGVVTVGSWQRPTWAVTRPDAQKIHKYKVPSNYEGRPDLIALELYNSDRLDWVLLAFNNVIDVFGWPKAGTVLEYPDESVVFPTL